MITKFTFDALNQNTSQIEAFDTDDQRTTTFNYDANSNLLFSVLPNASTTSYAYDYLDRRVRVIDAFNNSLLQRITVYQYDAADNLVNMEVSPVLVHLEGSVIEVSASTSTTKTKPGEPVEFSASVDKAPAGEDLIYSWTFGDGSRQTGQSVTHKFDEPGSYNVIVGVTTATQPSGGSDAVRVDVGKLKEGGPDREGGGRNQAEDAPDSGTADGGYGSGTSGYGTGSGGSGAGTGGASGAGTEAATGPGQTQEAPQKAKPEAAEPGGGASQASSSRRPPASSPAAPEGESAGARTGTPTDESGFGLPGAVVAFLVVGGLLGVGGLKEIRG